jgi:uncharacterized membrane protein YgcG
MEMIEPSVIANTIMAKLYDVLTNGDDTVPKSEDAFFSWCTPGIPFMPEDLEFLTQGLSGVVKPAARDALQPTALAATGGTPPPPPPPLTQEQINGLMADDTRRMYVQAEAMARLLDFVPDISSGTNAQFATLAVQNNDGSLSDIYDYTLRMSQVMKTELPQDVKDKIEKFNALLTKSKKVLDDNGDMVDGPPVESDLVTDYKTKQHLYDNAALEYNNHRIDALAGNDPRAVHDWALNASIYRDNVKFAMSDWVTNGHKEDYEKIVAFIEQVQQRDLSLLKQQYRDDFEKARLTSLVSGSDFFYTSLVPVNFAQSDGWSEFHFNAGDFNSHSDSSYSWSKTSGGGGFSYFGFGASGEHEESESHSEYHGGFDSTTVEMSFEIAQIPIARPWLRTAFLTSHYWRFDQNNVVVKGDVLSDGADVPHGKMPAIPMTAIFVRKLHLNFKHDEGFSNYVDGAKQQQSSGGGGFSFGPFFVGGSGAYGSGSGSSHRDYGFKFTDHGLDIDGMQLIGFKCHLMPKSPDPSGDIPAEAWI